MTLRHLTRLDADSASTAATTIYINDDGIEVDAVPAFRQFLRARGYAFGTRRRYEAAATRFIDFLIECNVFGQPSSPGTISDAMTAYPLFLRDGAKFVDPKFPTLGEYA